ncbi:MAG: endonuclease [Candidatus Kaiserbacteria bacterium]|nr:endonuclease [Candidatus Kaiserbacteria bacterium]
MRGHNTTHKRVANRVWGIRGVVFVMLILIAPHVAHANLIITEIMYDPRGSDSDREWIEVYNDGTLSVDLSALKTHIGGKNHVIIKTGSEFVEPNQHALIVRNQKAFETENGDTGVPIMVSAFSLPNTGAYISFVNSAGTDVASALYSKSDGASNDGNSLQRASIHVAFTSQAPSPGTFTTKVSVASRFVIATTKTAAVITKKPATQPSQDATVGKAKTSTSKKKKPTTQSTAADSWNDLATVGTTTVSSAPAESDQTASVAVATPPKHSWDVYLAVATGLAALVGLGSEAIRRLKKDEWDVEDVG